MIDDTVNVAARVEQLTKTMRDEILLTHSCVDALALRPTGLIDRGTQHDVAVVAPRKLLGRRGSPRSARTFVTAEELAGMPEIPSGRLSAMPHSYSNHSCCGPLYVWRISHIGCLRHELSANLC